MSLGLGLDFDLQPLVSDPWFGWSEAVDNYLDGEKNSMIDAYLKQGVNSNSGQTNDEKTTAALLDARLKVIEAHLKIPKFEPGEVIVISDDEDDHRSRDFNPKLTSTRIKEENENEK